MMIVSYVCKWTNRIRRRPYARERDIEISAHIDREIDIVCVYVNINIFTIINIYSLNIGSRDFAI